MNLNNEKLTQRGQDRRDLIGNLGRIAFGGAVGGNLVRNTISDIAVISASTRYNTVEKSAAGKLELIPHFAVSSVVELDLSDSLPPSQQ